MILVDFQLEKIGLLQTKQWVDFQLIKTWVHIGPNTELTSNQWYRPTLDQKICRLPTQLMSWLPTQQKLISASDWPNNVGSQAILVETPSGCQSTSDLTLASLLQAWISDTGPFQAYQSTFLPTDNALFGNASSFPTCIDRESTLEVFSYKNLPFVQLSQNVDKRRLLYLGDRGRVSPMRML